MKKLVVNINACFLMGRIQAGPTAFTTRAGLSGCEFDLITKTPKGPNLYENTITCVAEDKHAELILKRYKTGDRILVSGYIGEIGDFGSGEVRHGRHKIRITHLPIDNFNYFFMAGRIITNPAYNAKTKTTEFYIGTERRKRGLQVCRMRVVCRGYQGELLRIFSDHKKAGEYIQAMGFASLENGEHVLNATRVELMVPEEDKIPLMRKLKEESQRQRKQEEKKYAQAPAKAADHKDDGGAGGPDDRSSPGEDGPGKDNPYGNDGEHQAPDEQADNRIDLEHRDGNPEKPGEGDGTGS
jgi:hypothetical protein